MVFRPFLLRALTAALFLALCLAVGGSNPRSWGLGICFCLPFFWKGALPPSPFVPWKVEIVTMGLLAFAAAALLLLIDGVAHPRLASALVFPVFAAGSAARAALRSATAYPPAGSERLTK